MSSITKFDGNLTTYMQKFPDCILAQTRTKSDLIITVRSDNSSTSVFLPRVLPIDLSKQTSTQALAKSEEFLRLLSQGVIILIEPNASEKLAKALKSADRRVREIKGQDFDDLYSDDELAKQVGSSASADEPDAAVIHAVRAINDTLELVTKGDMSRGTADSAIAKLTELDLSCERAVDREYVKANVADKAVLAEHFD